MTPLMYATKDNKTSIMDRMIELGADVGARNNVSLQDFNNFFYLQKQNKLLSLILLFIKQYQRRRIGMLFRILFTKNLVFGCMVFMVPAINM